MSRNVQHKVFASHAPPLFSIANSNTMSENMVHYNLFYAGIHADNKVRAGTKADSSLKSSPTYTPQH